MTRESVSTEIDGLEAPSRLLLEALAALPAGEADSAAARPLRERLLQRAAQSVRSAAALHTVRGQGDWLPGGPGVRSRWLYQAPPGRAMRAGEPLRARLIALAAGAVGAWHWPQADVRREWLVIAGDVRVDGLNLAPRDYHVNAARRATTALRSTDGAMLYLREAPAIAGDAVPHTARDNELPWLGHAPGIERRVLWQLGSEAAMLYRVQAGAAVPRHGHGHDEECLMIEGEVFVDDILLRAGDYQLAPAGTHHDSVVCDSGGFLFGHGDVELAVTRR